MTDAFRDLLEQVEAHGGPIGSEPALKVFVLRDTGAVWSVEGILARAHVQDQFVGGLKRDLIERGCHHFGTWYHTAGAGGFQNPTWRAQIANGAGITQREASTELEAILKAYVAAAIAEGWGS